MSDLFQRFLQAFIPLFVAMDPIGLAALFLGFSQLLPAERRRRISRQAVWTASAVALLFLFLGQAIFHALNITQGDFQIAGGLILLILASRDLVQTDDAKQSAMLPEDFGVVPLGMPLIAGPAALATLLVCAKSVGMLVTLAAFGANLVFVALAFRWSDLLGRLIGMTGMRAISKIISLLLAAIAVSMIRQGWLYKG
ncbi:MAG: MarC family protein [Opitutaceae bacterium]|jgi:multiple antibiotic resistance protein|nr:MarC family protein [Opitutaceae bacterium]